MPFLLDSAESCGVICRAMKDLDQQRPAVSFTREDHRRLASRIKARREALGWKQRELGLRAGIASDRLSRLERGTPVRLEELVSLSSALGVPVDELIFDHASRSRDDLDRLAREIRGAVPREDLPGVLRVLRALVAGFQTLRAAEGRE